MRIEVKILFMVALITNSFFMCGDGVGFLAGCGRGMVEAWFITGAICLSSILIINYWITDGFYQFVGKWLLVLSIEGVLVGMAIVHTGAPMMEARLTDSQKALIESKNQQIAIWAAEIESISGSVEAYGTKYRTKGAALQDDKKPLREKISAATAERDAILKGASVPISDKMYAVENIIVRIVIGIINLVLACLIHSVFNDNHQKQSKLSKKSRFDRLYPDAVCRQSKTGKYVVYSGPDRKTVLGGGSIARLAWEDARCRAA